MSRKNRVSTISIYFAFQNFFVSITHIEQISTLFFHNSSQFVLILVLRYGTKTFMEVGNWVPALVLIIILVYTIMVEAPYILKDVALTRANTYWNVLETHLEMWIKSMNTCASRIIRVGILFMEASQKFKDTNIVMMQ